MKILHITAQKPDSTGSGVYLAQTVRALDALGCTQAVVAGIAPDDAPQLPVGVLFRPVVFDTPVLPFHVVGMSDEMPYASTRYRDMTPEMVARFGAAFTEALDEVCTAFQPDLILCHHLYLLCAIVTEFHPSCPIAGISHSTDIRQMRKIPLERERIRRGVARLQRIFALHAAQAEEIAEVYGVPADLIRVVGTGYDDGTFHRIEGLRDKTRHDLVYAGKIWRKKGVLSLLASLEALPYAPDSLTLRLAGGHGTEEEYGRIVAAARDCPYPVEFLGKLSQDALARAYNGAEVFVLPSFFEGLPLVLIEALACGCKAVVTDLPGIRAWLDERVPGAPVTYVAPPRMHDTDEPVPGDLPRFEGDLACAIQHAIEAPAPQVGVEHLSWRELARKLIQIQ